jgi:23S rRNA G2069 N7-methylase RlmK/C1962 C5-methylase RlmI
VIAAAKDYAAHGVGIDINPERIQEAEINAKKAGVEKLVRFEENDLFDADIQEATAGDKWRKITGSRLLVEEFVGNPAVCRAIPT